MTAKSKVVVLVTMACILAVVAFVLRTMGGAVASTIEEGVPYGIGYSYLADLDMGDGQVERARVFDFADRNLPERSLVVPLKDLNNVPLVVANFELPVGTVQKVRIMIAERSIEGVVYPAYEFVRWEYRFETTEKQSVVPVLKPRS